MFVIIPLRDLVIFPTMIFPIFIGRKKSLNSLEIANESDKRIFFTTQKDSKTENPQFEDVYEIGTVARILQTLKLPDGTVKILVEGIYRAKIKNYIKGEECDYVKVENAKEVLEYTDNAGLLRLSLIKYFDEYAKKTGKVSKELVDALENISDISNLSYMIASHLPQKITDLQEILEKNDVNERIEKIIEIITTEIEFSKIDEKIKQRVKAQLLKHNKEYYLNEQIKAINKELGRDEDARAEMAELEQNIQNSLMPEAIKDKALKELNKLKSMPYVSAEATVVKNYLDWLICTPWGIYTEDMIDLKKAQKILERDHFGLEKPKERILEYLAVKKLSDNLKGPVLCFVGPPGVGKTSLAKSIAEAMGRNFVRISLGGVRDEAEIRGHRRTYIGSLPGKIVQSVKKSGSMNPVFLLDEIDKVGNDYRGDPASALLEALDPEQNFTFTDHYLECELDLSKIFFITTANTTETIPMPLLDRMEIIRISGYTENEKLHIAKNYLVKKQLIENGLIKMKLNISDNGILSIIRHYTREAGVRGLQREIASTLRKCAKIIVLEENSKTKKIQITDKNIEKFLGVKKFKVEDIKENEVVGVATGLAWTPFGGEILQTEVAIFEGIGKMEITGHIGDVMQESAKIAHSVAKTLAPKYKIPAYKFKEYDIHIHVPEGAVPKDGPSAGVTITTSIISALAETPVNVKFAMTGEITLRGKVLPVGGIKEKVLAAHRVGIRDIIIPADNKKDLTELPEDVSSSIRFYFAEDISDILDRVLIKQKGG